MEGVPADRRTGGLSKLYGAAVMDDKEDCVDGLKDGHPSANTITDLLFITANEGAQSVFRLVLDYDETHTHALSSAGPAVLVRSTTQTAGRRGGPQPEVPLQQQQPVQVFEQLLLTSLVAESVYMVWQLLRHPAAAGVGVAGVAKLMHAAALLGNTQNPYGHNSVLCMLAQGLPAAKEITPSTLASVVRTLMHTGKPISDLLLGLFGLPAARSLPSPEICDLLVLAVRKDARDIMRALARLATRCDLQRADIHALLSTMLKELGCSDFCVKLKHLKGMNLGQYLNTAETLALLTKVAKGKKGSLLYSFDHDGPTCLQAVINALGFQHKTVDQKDASSYVTFLQAVAKGTYEEHLEEAVRVVLKANSGPKLSRQHCMQLLRRCVPSRMIPTRYLKFPASQSLPPKDIQELLELCFEERAPKPAGGDDSDASSCSSECCEGPPTHLVRDLTKLPRAKELTADSILQLMQRTLQQEDNPRDVDDVLCSLAALPLAQQISAADARGLVLTAFKQDEMKQLNSLCKCLPACAAAWEEFDEGDILQQRLQKALAADRGEEVCSLLQHARMQQHAADVLPRILLAGFRCFDCERQRHGRFWHAASKEQAGQHAEETLKATLSQVQLLQLLRLPAAAGLSAAVVHELMQLSLQRMDGALLQELVQLPAAQQLSDDDVTPLLRLAAGQAAAGTAGPAAAAGSGQPHGDGAGASSGAEPAINQQQPPAQRSRSQRGKRDKAQQQLQQEEEEGQGQPAQQQECNIEGSERLPGLVLLCLQQPKGAAGLFPLLLLPWAKQLPAACVKALLQAAAERHARVLFEHLLQLPQAPRADPEVQAYAEVMRFSCATADLTGSARQDNKCQWYDSEVEEEEEEEGDGMSSSSEPESEGSEG